MIGRSWKKKRQLFVQNHNNEASWLVQLSPSKLALTRCFSLINCPTSRGIFSTSDDSAMANVGTCRSGQLSWIPRPLRNVVFKVVRVGGNGSVRSLLFFSMYCFINCTGFQLYSHAPCGDQQSHNRIIMFGESGKQKRYFFVKIENITFSMQTTKHKWLMHQIRERYHTIMEISPLELNDHDSCR